MRLFVEGTIVPESPESGVEAFEAWCEELAARKARNAVPGEPAAPMVNAVLVTSAELVDVFLKGNPEYAGSRNHLEAFAKDFEPGLDVDIERWHSVSNH